jgi:hypothetical protein
MPSVNIDGDKHVIAFDIQEEVMKPFSLGYVREAFVKLDSILDKVLEYRIRASFPSKDSQELISIMSGTRANSSFSSIAKARGIITISQKDRIDKFKSVRNTMAHNALGELDLMVNKKQEDMAAFLKSELDRGISLVKELVAGDKK